MRVKFIYKKTFQYFGWALEKWNNDGTITASEKWNNYLKDACKKKHPDAWTITELEMEAGLELQNFMCGAIYWHVLERGISSNREKCVI